MSIVNITGIQKYVEFTPGHVIINGQVLFVDTTIRITDTQLVGAPGGDFGDYLIYLRPNRSVMESYYSTNWEYRIQGFAPGVTYSTSVVNAVTYYDLTDVAALATIKPDELVIGLIQKRAPVSETVLAGIPLHRGYRLINSKDISINAIKTEHILAGSIKSEHISSGQIQSSHFAVDMATQAELDVVNTSLSARVTALEPKWTDWTAFASAGFSTAYGSGWYVPAYRYRSIGVQGGFENIEIEFRGMGKMNGLSVAGGAQREAFLLPDFLRPKVLSVYYAMLKCFTGSGGMAYFLIHPQDGTAQQGYLEWQAGGDANIYFNLDGCKASYVPVGPLP